MAEEDFQWWKSAQCSEGSPNYPDRTRHSVVHGCIEHRLGSTLECIDGVRCMDNNRENTSHQHTRVRSHTQSHGPLAAEAYGSDSPGCIKQLHCSVLHQQAGLNMVNTAMQTDQEATPHVSGQPNSTLGTTHPQEIERLADILSRPSQMSGTVWSLHPSVIRAQEWGIPLLDLFAMRWNHKLPLFVSPVPDPSAMAVDALSMSWKALWAYAYPSPSLLPQVLEKTQWDQCELILIALHWPQAIWFPLLLGMLVQSPLRIPNIPRLISQPWG